MTDDYYLDPRVAAAYDGETAATRAIVRDDIPFYLDLAREAAAAGQRVLELGCGTGRVTLPIAEAGVPIVGIDRSPAMIEVARRKAAGLVNVSWVEADMADFELPRRFGLVIIPFRSFCLLLSVEEQTACLARVHEHLVPGGRLALNVPNPDLLLRASRLGAREGPAAQLHRDGAGGRRPLATRPGWAGRASNGTRLNGGEGDDGAVIVRVQGKLRLRYVFRPEMERLFALAGFNVEALYGWFDRRPFAGDSSEMVWLARRA